MDEELFTQLCEKLQKVQYKKKIGIISHALFKNFIHFMEETENRLSKLTFYKNKSVKPTIKHATLSQKTTVKEYDYVAYDGFNWTVYNGPYTSIHYKDREYFFQRCESKHETHCVYREYPEGVTLEIELPDEPSFTIESLISIAQNKADLANSEISCQQRGLLNIVLTVPLEHL